MGAPGFGFFYLKPGDQVFNRESGAEEAESHLGEIGAEEEEMEEAIICGYAHI